MKLPSEFISTITNTYGEDGENLIANLPALIEDASQKWSLTNVEPVSNLSYNFVAYATSPLTPLRVGGGNVVLKIGLPHDGLKSEIATLHLFNGEGACRLIEADEEKGFLLLERLRPGAMLSTLEDDEEATHIAAEVMQKIWRTLDNVTLSDSEGSLTHQDGLFGRDDHSLRVTKTDKFIRLSEWFEGLHELRAMFDGGTGPLDEKLVARTERSVRDFLIENHTPVLMHGDFHHFNILSSERGWLVIDPKGVIGPAGYEVGPLMINPWGSLSDGISDRLILRRVDILHEQLGWERERILEWSLAHGILSA